MHMTALLNSCHLNRYTQGFHSQIQKFQLLLDEGRVKITESINGGCVFGKVEDQ